MSFEVAVDANQDDMVIAIGPFDPGTDFGPEFPIYTVDDDQQGQMVLDNLTTYLCTDHQTIKLEPC